MGIAFHLNVGCQQELRILGRQGYVKMGAAIDIAKTAIATAQHQQRKFALPGMLHHKHPATTIRDLAQGAHTMTDELE